MALHLTTQEWTETRCVPDNGPRLNVTLVGLAIGSCCKNGGFLRMQSSLHTMELAGALVRFSGHINCHALNHLSEVSRYT